MRGPARSASTWAARSGAIEMPIGGAAGELELAPERAVEATDEDRERAAGELRRDAEGRLEPEPRDEHLERGSAPCPASASQLRARPCTARSPSARRRGEGSFAHSAASPRCRGSAASAEARRHSSSRPPFSTAWASSGKSRRSRCAVSQRSAAARSPASGASSAASARARSSSGSPALAAASPGAVRGAAGARRGGRVARDLGGQRAWEDRREERERGDRRAARAGARAPLARLGFSARRKGACCRGKGACRSRGCRAARALRSSRGASRAVRGPSERPRSSGHKPRGPRGERGRAPGPAGGAQRTAPRARRTPRGRLGYPATRGSRPRARPPGARPGIRLRGGFESP